MMGRRCLPILEAHHSTEQSNPCLFFYSSYQKKDKLVFLNDNWRSEFVLLTVDVITRLDYLLLWESAEHHPSKIMTRQDKAKPTFWGTELWIEGAYLVNRCICIWKHVNVANLLRGLNISDCESVYNSWRSTHRICCTMHSCRPFPNRNLPLFS